MAAPPVESVTRLAQAGPMIASGMLVADTGPPTRIVSATVLSTSQEAR